jgi:hypothetical protein
VTVAWSIFNLVAGSRDDQSVTPSRFGGVITRLPARVQPLRDPGVAHPVRGRQHDPSSLRQPDV